ncbi:citrate synthase [Salirhabdus euzebyi]|uniref:citrate synthase (unknown stereospecificity) n=1 Tax=Salirhabdus euzebyi TaxID=394506 RepID=A0A841Q8H3_9BACI|nr:citryl-CoA lyase [Salirhabdus euzebyi]MBB6454577.1 citrate synthase [Salirhabdus euzebyi]
MKFNTSIGFSDSENILIYGKDLCNDLIGNVNLGDMAFIAATHRLPTENESRMLNAIMVALCEHGFTPSSISTRLTYLGAPESTQAAVAAGLLGAGNVYLGSMESTARVLQESVGFYGNLDNDEMVNKILSNYKDKRFPGFGHPIHKQVDPRSKKLFEMAENLGFKKGYSKLITDIHKSLCEIKQKEIVLNASGAVGAILSDMGFKWNIVKCFALAARSVGLIGHILEEQGKDRISQDLWDYVQENTKYNM